MSQVLDSAPPMSTNGDHYINTGGMNELVFLLYIDAIICLCFAVFAVLTLPRLVARFSRRSEWFSGLFLHAHSKDADDRYNAVPVSHEVPRGRRLESDRHQARIAKKEMYDPKNLPSGRIASWSSRFYPVSALLGRQITSRFTIGRLLVMLGYFAIVSIAGIYKSDPFQYWTREGIIVVAQVPIIYALATKNNVFGTFMAVGYEKINWLHRFVGRLMLVISTIHSLGYFYTQSFEKIGFPYTLKHTSSPSSGTFALIGINLLTWFSLPFFRENYYKVFLITHIVGFVLFPIGLAMHYSTGAAYIYTGVGIYVFDHVIRILKTRIRRATLVSMPELEMTRIEIPRLSAGWRPGQHVRIRVLSGGMGFFGWFEVHPFTIAGVSGNDMVLMCKNTGDWTKKLYELGQGGSSPETATAGQKVTVVIEGPYGGISHTLMDSFSGALFFSGGSGITFSLAIIQDLVMKDTNGKSRVQVIELVWSVKDAGSLIPMLPIFNSLISQAPSTDVHISVYYTRAQKVPIDFTENLPPNIVVLPGRPEIPSIVSSVIDKTCDASQKPLGLVVGVCGSASLGHSVKEAVGNVDSAHRKHVGGIELCEEVFGF